MCRKLTVALFLLTLWPLAQPLPAADVSAQSAGSWSRTGDMNAVRDTHTATLLDNGQVLVTGVGGITPAELYDPTSGTWALTGSEVSCPRGNHTATLMTSGKVLVAGGMCDGGILPAAAELYDPTTGTWSVTGSMTIPRRHHTATLLADGKVLLVGGCDNFCVPAIGTAELYDPVTGEWSLAGELLEPRNSHTSTLLPDGRVLVVGGGASSGQPVSSVEIYEPATGTWSQASSMLTPRAAHTSTILLNGKVLVAGGCSDAITCTGVVTAELYDPSTGSWALTGNMSSGRFAHTTARLLDGRVLIAGGVDLLGGSRLSSSDLYDPASGTWSPRGDMIVERDQHTMTLLNSGNVLVAGGGGQSSAELYTPDISLPQADLEIIDLIPGSAVICVGDDAEFTTTIRNSGISLSGEYVVRKTYDGDEFDSIEPGLDSGESRIYRETVQSPSLGPHTLASTVDPDNLIAETDETNNQASITFTVEDCAPRALNLPWRAGETWFFTAGPHCDPPKPNQQCSPGADRYGLDFAPPAKSDPVPSSDGWVAASAGGIVRVASRSLVEIDHGGGLRTGYYHLQSSTIAVQVGDVVSAGAILGKSSKEALRGGRATGAHVHFYLCMTTDPEAVCLGNDSLVLPADGLVLSGWTAAETSSNYNGTMTKGQDVRVANAIHCAPDLHSGTLPKRCVDQRNDLTAE